VAEAGSKDQADLLRRDFEVAKEAVAKKDPNHLNKCIGELLRIGAPAEGISGAIADCPIGLFEKTGFSLAIFSGALNRTIVLGTDISWENVHKLCLMEPRPDAGDLALIIEALSIFGGTIVDSAGEGPPQQPGQKRPDTQSGLFPAPMEETL
jgi:hypothetical protein